MVELIIPKGYKLVGIYHNVSCYGGPEEGGWFYDQFTHIRSAVIPVDADESLLLKQDEQGEDRPDPPCPEWMEDMPLHKGESLSSGAYMVFNEEGPGQHDNTGDAAPHYE